MASKIKTMRVPKKPEPVLIDRVIQTLQEAILKQFSWVEVAYGRSYKSKGATSRDFYPAAYSGGSRGEYTSLLPDDRYSGFSWFDIYDPQDIKVISPGFSRIVFKGALIFWYRLDKIFSDRNALYTEEIKNDVLKFLTGPGINIEGGFLKVTKLYENAENVYRGYNLKGLDEKYFSYPFAGLRVELEIQIEESC